LHTKDAAKEKLWYLDSGCSKHMIGDASFWTGLKYGGFVTYEDNNRG